MNNTSIALLVEEDLTNTAKLIKISIAKHDGVRNINKKEK